MKEQYQKSLVFKMLVLILLLILFLYNQNNALQISRFVIKSRKIQEDLSGFKIVQLSDLHGKTFGKNQEKLLSKIKDEQPTIIVFTGDAVDARRGETGINSGLYEELVAIAPTYFVPGNHEAGYKNYKSFENQIKNKGIIVLRNESVKIKIGGQSLLLIGVDDQMFRNTMTIAERVNVSRRDHEDLFAILLAHRPHLIEDYLSSGVDLVFSGHAHGGQIRLPFWGPMIAPDQGLRPKYAEGLYVFDTMKLVVSRGLGASLFPQRLFNRPEIVVVTLKSEDEQ